MRARGSPNAAARVGVWLLLALCLAVLMVVGIGPRTGAYRTLTVLTGSMAPALPAGSVAVVVPIPSRDVRPGQIISYQAPTVEGPVVTHRVVRVESPGEHPVVITKGDANESSDPWRARIDDPVVWEVRAVIPHLGQAIRALRLPGVRHLSLWAIPLLLALIWMRDVWGRVEGRVP